MVANILEWTKWDLKKIKNQPFRPMMMLMKLVNQQKEEFERELEAEDSGDKQDLHESYQQWAAPILDNPEQYRR